MPSRNVGLIVLGVVALVWAFLQSPAAHRRGLSVSEERDRIVLNWSGPVKAPMKEHIAAALDRYKSDQRRLVLILDSPGGEVEHGRKVIAAIRSHASGVDTFVRKGSICASMCVPIYLAGSRRMSDPEARFMFHQVIFQLKPEVELERRRFSAGEAKIFRDVLKDMQSRATDDLFRLDFNLHGLNVVWLAKMRRQIAGGDVWLKGRQLFDENSGMVDMLTPVPIS